MIALFSLTLFLGSFLLFCVQPMLGKMVLPLLGGVPAVWNTCLFFFQIALLGGYGYVHYLSRRLPRAWQFAVHVLFILIPCLTLPLAIGEFDVKALSEGARPLPWLLRVLLFRAGPVFLAVSTTAPLVQWWFSRTRHVRAKDPYFLYVASNVGSLFGLLSYPFLIESSMGLPTQTRLWFVGYLLLAGLIIACAIVAARTKGPGELEAVSAPVPWSQWARWIFYAFVPSSLLLGTTTYLSTEVGAIPLLWVIPLTIYLFSFVLAFSKSSSRVYSVSSRIFGLFAILLIVAILVEASEPSWIVMPLHLATLFLAACVCHGALFSERPEKNQLTKFYFAMSVGGALGGSFNALLAPFLFPQLSEYTLAILLACLCRRKILDEQNDYRYPLGVGALTLAMGFVATKVDPSFGKIAMLATFTLPVLLCYRAVSRPRRFAFVLAAIALAGTAFPGERGQALLTSRNFFGVLRVTRDPASQFLQLVHGNTLHGKQTLAEETKKEPLMYYSRGGPAGQIFEATNRRKEASVAVVGLGTGALSCLSKPDQNWTYYEIDPTVVEIARTSGYFTYFKDCSPVSTSVVVGDARVQLQRAPDGFFNLLVIDAFSSDAIPVHLVTRQALEMYSKKIAKDGLIAFHVSNRYLNLKPVLSSIAHSLNLAPYVRFDADRDEKKGITSSEWVVMAATTDSLGAIATDARWHRLPLTTNFLWTDDHSSVVQILKW